jgi:hypothetical protein
MKTKVVLVLIAITATFGWNVEAQLRVVSGQIYNIYQSVLWKSMDGDVLKVLTNGLVLSTFTIEKKQQAVVVRRLKANSYMTTDESKKYHDVTEMVDVGEEKVPGRKIILRNYPTNLDPAVGQTISFWATKVGTIEYEGDTLELWDYGTTPTQDDLRKLKDEADARQKAAQTQFEEQRRVATEKAAAAKRLPKPKF